MKLITKSGEKVDVNEASLEQLELSQNIRSKLIAVIAMFMFFPLLFSYIKGEIKPWTLSTYFILVPAILTCLLQNRKIEKRISKIKNS